MTQADIARLAGTSQSVVSLVINGRAEGRVAPELAARVRVLLRTGGYLRDRAQRVDATRVIGVFTYEAVFPSVAVDFYHPFLAGLERAAEASGHDLLLFTSASVESRSSSGVERRSRVLDDHRLGRVDGCILLGREVDTEDLARLTATGYPYVSVGRRDDADGPVPYVGADYVTATKEIAAEAIGLGHRRFLYVPYGSDSESSRDRYRGFRTGIEETGLPVSHRRLDHLGARDVLGAAAQDGATCIIVEDASHGEAIARATRRAGLVLGRDLSLVLLHEMQRPLVGTELTRLRIPRAEMATEAFALLLQITGAAPATSGETLPWQRLLPVTRVTGRTLGQAPV